MSKTTQLRMIPLKLPQIGLCAFLHELTAVKLDFLLWGWNWMCQDMVCEWQKGRDQPTRGFRPHVERWDINDWEQVLGRCARKDGHLLFESESIKVTKEEEIFFAALFKSSKSSKNGYKTRDYKDRYRRNVAVALLQLLQLHRTTYITFWQVAFVKLALAGAPIHWARILWKITSNPGRYVKDVEIDTDEDETLACTPPAQPRAEGESLAARVPPKRRWPKQKACKLVLPASNAKTWRAAEGKKSPSSGEDRSARTAERSADLPAPKARTPSAEARRPPGQEKQHAAPTNVPAADKCSEQVPFADSTSGQEPSVQRRSGKEPADKAPSAQGPSAQELVSWEPLGQEPSAEAPSAQGPSAQGTSGSPTALDILARSSAAAAAAEAEATQPNSWESPGNSVATKILNLEDDGDESGSDDKDEQSVKGTPTTALCEQVVPLSRYLDRKVAKYIDPRYHGSYVKLVRRRTRTKVKTSKLLASLDEDIKDLRLKNEALRGHLAIVRKLQKAVNKTRDDKFEDAKKEFAKE
ncbi:hypothetical protein AXG93_2139s1190 [Marchantia polymorpha subsp. ruderalis]|uniref:Uncharacterized protein n=1 Tax=Marchantia polymorpha subsp. ruderalis TaxID=1480154 RepID=A0A176WMU4_MARPO|nr:hypothetical protein AXG93_2139s1190 [Marchantia polymorpha subsp. ruderalis]